MKKDDEISFATSRNNVIKFKIVFVGDQGVGKSSIINRFIKNEFDSTHNPTIGIDFISKNLNINNKSIRLQLWDTAGQQRFRSLIPSYLKDCNAALIVFDITNQNSFDAISKWIDFVRQSRGSDILIYVIANKLDLQAQRVVSMQKAEAAIKAQGIFFSEVSAKSVFQNICATLMNIPTESLNQTQQPKQQVATEPEPIKNKGTTLKAPSKQGPERIKQKNCC